MRAIFIFTIAAISVLTALGGETNFTPLAISGQTFIHDPSTIVRDGARFYIFGTGPGIRTKSSSDLINWTMGNPVFAEPPAWTTNAVPGFNGYFWAPDVVRVHGKFFLYYSASTWGKKTSAIGLATNPTLDATATNFLWRDAGEVIHSTIQNK